MTWLDRFVCSLVDQAAIQVAPDEAAALRAHLERVLRVVSEIGGYMSPEHQETLDDIWQHMVTYGHATLWRSSR